MNAKPNPDIGSFMLYTYRQKEMIAIKKRKMFFIYFGLVISVVVGVFFFVGQQKGEIILVSKEELNEMIDSKESFYVYVGRPNCPDCQDFYPEFEKEVYDNRIIVYYFNTKVKASKKREMSEYVKSMGINEIPAIVEINKGSIIKVYDGQVEDDMRNLYEKWKGKKLW